MQRQTEKYLVMKTITNGIITIRVAEHGAELSSLVLNATGREYLWQADPAFWKRHSPVLFPIVGSVWDGEYRSAGPGAEADVKPQTYRLGQHGFARDMDFTLLSDAPDSDGNPQLMFVLESNEETLQKYPYTFRLEIGYRLVGRGVEVIWRVINPDKLNEMKFQIGAHPAFYWPLLSNEDVAAGVERQNEVLAQSTNRGFFKLGTDAATLCKSIITEKGCVDPAQSATVETEAGGYLPIFTSSFDRDALIFENGQVPVVTLCDADRKPYLTLKSEAPLMGLWSPPGKNAPFVCLEPWYGRCDRVHYAGTYEEKDWIQTITPSDTFEARYQIVIE